MNSVSAQSSAQLEIEHRLLKPVKATPESLEGYGWVIGEPDTKLREKIDFYDEVEVRQPVDFRSNDDTCLNLVSFKQRAFDVRWMEYHVKHTQTFIPLMGKSFYMVLGKPTVDAESGEILPDATPDPDTVKAFYFDGSAGIVMKKGVWHEVPFPASGEVHFICICTNETNDNLEDQGAHGECNGGDLAKRNIGRRFGFTFEIDMESA